MKFNFKIKRKKKIKKPQNKKVNFYFGEQDQMDLISYSGLKEKADYLLINKNYVRTLFISGYPYVASTGWLSMLINFNHNIDVSYHIEQVDPLLALPKLNRKITELESTRRNMLKTGRVISSEITDPLDSAKELKDKILRGQEKLFQVSIYMTLTAKTLSELDKLTTLLETVMSQRLFYIRTATFQQLDGLQSILPRGENKLDQKRNLDSSSAALTFPFVSSELVQESGILYGINKSNNSLVIIDRFALTNANSIIFAQSGAGKSYTAKVEILRQLMQGAKVIVIDPEREYKQLAKSVNGTYIRLSAKSKEKINPFDFSTQTITGENALSQQIQDLTQIISLMVGNLSPEEKAVVDKALIKTYKKKGFTINGKNKISKDFPKLKDFYQVLKTMKQKDLATNLEKFVKGSLATVFDKKTNIKLNNRLVVFDIKDLPESIRPIMMMIVANFVNSEVKSKPQKRILVIDEGWLLLDNQDSAKFISGLTRRARKYFLGVSIISQQANDFLNSNEGRAIASQSALRILLKQDTTTIKKVSKEFNLSSYEEQFLLTCDRGEALIIADQNHVSVKIVASDKEHGLLTTDPREIYS
ncbi:MAG: ATP-binding protein [Chitinophagales bacterium]|jgi:type IV secretory pathway VirB4 component|nr:ATP-binding protein [Chitinophagales bacterium]